MKEWLKELGWWFEDRLKGLCGEITPDKRITVILIMLLVFTIGNLYFTFSTIYNWGREKEREEQMKIEHIRGPELKNENSHRDFIDSAIDKRLFDLYRQEAEQDSTEVTDEFINKENNKQYERKTENQPRVETKA